MAENKDITRAKTMYKSMTTRINPKDRNFCNGYRGCTNDFINLDIFLEWCLAQEGFYRKDEEGRPWELDKDILIPRNRSYSPTTCCFVPRKLNARIKVSSKRGRDTDLPIGVYSSGAATGRCYVFLDQKINPQAGRSVTFYEPEEAHRFWLDLRIEKLKLVKSEYHYLGDNVLEGLDKHIDLYQICLDTGTQFRA